MASTATIPDKETCTGSLWPPGRAPRPTADGIVCVLKNRQASADARVRFTAVCVDASARVAACDERGALLIVDAGANRFERVSTLDAQATALAWVDGRLACAVCHPRAPRLVAIDATTGAVVSEIAAAHDPGTSIATLEAHDRLVVTAARDAARFWTVDGDWLRQSAFEPGAEVAAAAFGPDRDAIVLDRTGVVHVVDPSTGQAKAQLSPRQNGTAPSRGVWCCVTALAGGAVVAGGPLIAEWAAPGSGEGTFDRLSSPPPRARSVVALLRAGSDLLALGEDGRLNALDMSKPSAAAAILSLAPRAVVIAAAAAGASVAVATADSELLLLDLAVARCRRPAVPTPLQRYFPPEPELPPSAPAPAPAPWDFKGPPALPPPPPRWATPRRGAPPLHRVARPRDADDLTPARLRRLLGEQGEFPAEHRSLAWRALLDLPEKQAAFDALRFGDEKRGAAVDAAERAAAACRKRAAKLPRSNAATALVECCGALGRWCPALADADWLPAAVYPFARAFEGDALCTFETVVCLFGKWARGWLACWPEPPLPALDAAERLLQNYDAEVAAHLGALGCTPTDWAWPILRSFLSECLKKQDWLRLWDHVLARPDRAHRLLLAPVAVAAAARGPMLACESVHDVVRLVRSPLTCGALVWPEMRALERRCAADPLLARLARAEPDGAKTTGPAALARGLASIAGAANAANDRFPVPLPRGDVAAYPRLAYEPRQATDIARAEFGRVAAEHHASRDRRLAENAEAWAAGKTEDTAKKLLADQEAAARAEEAALARQLAENAKAERAKAITAERARARRLAACDRAEAAAKSAEAAAARRKKAQGARAVAAMQSASLRAEREAEEAELEDAVARREREALERVEAAKAALVENSLVLADSNADDFSTASAPPLLLPDTEPLDEAIARARSAVEELRE